MRRPPTIGLAFTSALLLFANWHLRAQATGTPALARQTASANASPGNVRKGLCTVLMFGGDQTSMDQLDRLSHDPNGDVAAEALRAKEAIRVRTDAASTAPTPGSH